jgi:hypothetical protein
MVGLSTFGHFTFSHGFDVNINMYVYRKQVSVWCMRESTCMEIVVILRTCSSILKTVFRVCGKDGDGVIYAIYRKQMNGSV